MRRSRANSVFPSPNGKRCSTGRTISGEVAELQARWKSLRARGYSVREVACAGAPRTMLCVDFGDARAVTVALSAGTHGDERAAPWGLLALAEQDALDERFAYRIWPCVNPSGCGAGTRENAEGLDVNRSFSRGGQTPEARAILTANRDRKFGLSIDLHEDCDAEGFYLYEYGVCDLGNAVVARVRDAGWPIQELAGFELGVPFEPDHVGEGTLRAPAALEASHLGGLSYSLSIVRHAARRAMTFETPAVLRWEDRVAIHVLAVLAAIEKLAAS